MKQRLLGLPLAFGLVVALCTATVAEASASEIIGLRGLSEWYAGQESYVSAQDPWEYEGPGPDWSRNPNTITNYYSWGLMEGGNSKSRPNWGYDFSLSPYRGVQNANDGSAWSDVYSPIGLVAGQYYDYAIYPTGVGTRFVVRFCGPSFCQEILDADPGTSRFAYAGSGGRGDGATAPIGFIRTTENRFLNADNLNWYYYCYTQAYNDVAWDGGTITSCQGGIDPPEWNVNYQ